MDKTCHLQILLCKEGSEGIWKWVAQCLQYDIAAQGNTIAEAMVSFERTFCGQIVVDLAVGRKPLEGIPEAPRAYWDEFQSAEKLADTDRPMHMWPPPESIPPPLMINAVADDMRVA